MGHQSGNVSNLWFIPLMLSLTLSLSGFHGCGAVVILCTIVWFVHLHMK